MRRVAITGMGAICALGKNVAEFAQALAEGRPGIGPIESADVSQIRFPNGAEVKGYTHAPYFDDRRADFIDRFAQFAVIAAAKPSPMRASSGLRSCASRPPSSPARA